MVTKPTVAKIAIGVLGAGGLGAATYQGYQMLNKKEVKNIEKVSNSSQLEKEMFTPLTDLPANETHWTTILASYVAADESLKFQGFNGQKPTEGTTKAVDTLKAKCKLALKSDDSALLTKARKWCVEPIKASDLLTKRGSRVLKTVTTNADEEIAQWKKRITAFNEAKTTNKELEKLITLEAGPEKEANNIVAMKKKCKAFGDTESHSKDFETNLKNLDAWCVDKE